MSKNKLTVIILLLAHIAVTFPEVTIAYSDEYCTSIIIATADAMDREDWDTLLQASIDGEKNCKKYRSVKDFSGFLSSQAAALISLNRLDSAMNAVDKCLLYYRNPQCVILKGIISFQLGNKDDSHTYFIEAIKLAEDAKDITVQELEKITRNRDESELTSATKYMLESEINKYESIISTARRYLAP